MNGLCNVCRGMVFSPWPHCDMASESTVISVRYLHHRGEQSLRSSAADGCHLCKLIAHRIARPGFEPRDDVRMDPHTPPGQLVLTFEVGIQSVVDHTFVGTFIWFYFAPNTAINWRLCVETLPSKCAS